MKKLFILFLLLPLNLNAKVALNRCIDGDTASFFIDGKEQTVRFLAINTPESTNKKEFYGKEASEYACKKLTDAKNINLELDKKSDKFDKYNRMLAWVFVDGVLLQKEIVKNGYGKVDYIYGDYKYLNILYEQENNAKKMKIGIYQDQKENELIYLILFIIIIFGSVIIPKKQRRQIKKIFKTIKKIEV